MNNELERIAKEYVRKAEEIYLFILALLGVNDRRELTLYVQKQRDIHFEISGKKYVIMPHGRGCFFPATKMKLIGSLETIKYAE